MALSTTISHPSASPPADLMVVDNGMVFADDQDQLEYLWFRLVEREAGYEYPLHRVVRLKMLRYLPQETRQDAGLLDTMRTALTGLYNQRRADYDLCMLVAGIFDPPLGVVQCYGVVGMGDDMDQAVHHANLGMGAFDGVMANFPQSRLESLDIQKSEWLRRSFLEMGQSLVVIGQPDPRQSARGMGREGPAEKSITMTGETAYTMQQNEMLFRAMARLEEEFLFVVMASRLAQHDMATMLEGIASEASVLASRQTGSKAISFGLSFPLIASGGLGQSTGTAYGRSDGQSVSDGVSESDSISHTEGHATSVGHAVTDGTAHTVGRATTSGGSSSRSVSVVDSMSHVAGESQGTADTVGSADTVGTAHTVGHASSRGGSSSHSSSVTHVPAVSSYGGGVSHSVGTASTAGAASTTGATHTSGASSGESHTSGVNQGTSSGTTDTHSGSLSQSYDARGSIGIISGGGSHGVQETVGRNTSEGASRSASHTYGGSSGESHTSGHSIGQTESASETTSGGNTRSSSWSTTPAHSVASSSSSHSSFSSATDSVADTLSQAHTDSQAHSESRGTSQADGVSRSVGVTTGSSSFSSSTNSVADTTSHSETSSWSKTDSVSDGTAHGVGRSHATGRSSGTSIGRALGVARSMGMSAGVVPSISATKAYQWWDDKAVQLTTLLRTQEELLRQATLEGAFLTDAYMLCRTERGAAAAEAAIRQAFHGSELPVVTPVQTRWLTAEEQAYIRLHAMCFTQSTREEPIAGALEAYKDSTMLLPLQLAAYMAPALFEEGTAVTTQERIPAFAFVPDMPGDVVLAHLWSTETGRLTKAQLRLSEDRMFHTAFAADTGYGKTVAAERLAVETTKLWKYRTVVLDFGAGWRRLLNAPLGEPGRVEVWQVFPGATVPFRWNPLQIGKRINPERQMRATCELVRNAGRMGPRQLGFMRRALKEIYLKHGVLTSFREVLADSRWNTVQDDEWAALDAARSEQGLGPRKRERKLYLGDLKPFERQALAVHRSKRVDIRMWHGKLDEMFQKLRPGTTDHTSLQGVLLRIEPFIEGEMEQMYGHGEGSYAIEELGILGPDDDPWGISILEGGAEMDEFAKAVVFGLVAWHLYNDAVVRRRQSIGGGPQRKLQIFFEEANKVLSGVAVDTDDSAGASGGGVTSEIWKTMWRDGRKFGIWLHVIAQTVSELPLGILASCNNAFFSQSKHPRDRDLVMAHLAFSEKGFTDEDYKRFISRIALAMAVCKLGYSEDIVHTTPFLCKPVMVAAQEPTDPELLICHQAMQEARKRNSNVLH